MSAPLRLALRRDREKARRLWCDAIRAVSIPRCVRGAPNALVDAGLSMMRAAPGCAAQANSSSLAGRTAARQNFDLDAIAIDAPA
jgi:hypothetical protein